MIIEVNNHRSIEIEAEGGNKIIITHRDADGKAESKVSLFEDEIIMLVNLFENMDKSCYLIGDFAMKVLRESGADYDIQEYRIKQ